MKLTVLSHRSHAMTLIEVFVVVLVLFVLIWVLVPAFSKAKADHHWTCASQLKQICLATKEYAYDNGGRYPTTLVSPTTWASHWPTEIVRVWWAMSNYLTTPKLLLCPLDEVHRLTSNFAVLKPENISYFLNESLTTATSNSLMIAGDSNLTTNGVPVRPGLLGVSTNLLLGWTAARPRGHGLMVKTDGAVAVPYPSGSNDTYVTEHLNDRAHSPAFRAVGALPDTGANLVIP